MKKGPVYRMLEKEIQGDFELWSMGTNILIYQGN
jgi:hypothetical protein